MMLLTRICWLGPRTEMKQKKFHVAQKRVNTNDYFESDKYLTVKGSRRFRLWKFVANVLLLLLQDDKKYLIFSIQLLDQVRLCNTVTVKLQPGVLPSPEDNERHCSFCRNFFPHNHSAPSDMTSLPHLKEFPHTVKTNMIYHQICRRSAGGADGLFVKGGFVDGKHLHRVSKKHQSREPHSLSHNKFQTYWANESSGQGNLLNQMNRNVMDYLFVQRPPKSRLE